MKEIVISDVKKIVVKFFISQSGRRDFSEWKVNCLKRIYSLNKVSLPKREGCFVAIRYMIPMLLGLTIDPTIVSILV